MGTRLPERLWIRRSQCENLGIGHISRIVRSKQTVVNYPSTRTQSEQPVKSWLTSAMAGTLPVMSPCLAALSSVPRVRARVFHSSRCIGMARQPLFEPASDSRTSGGVSVSSVQKSVQLRRVAVSAVGELRSVSTRSALALCDYKSRQSPREVLGLAMHELRRAAEAKKSMRIARRLASLAEGKTERVSWSSRKQDAWLH